MRFTYLKEKYSYLAILFGIFGGLIFSNLTFAQVKRDTALEDSLFKKMTIEDLIQIREYYNSKVGELRKEEKESLSKGMKLGESFLGEKGAHIEDRDKVYVRVAEYYISDAYDAFDKAQEEYEKQYQEYEKEYDKFLNGEIDTEPVQPEFPKLDFTKAIEIYDRLLKEYPASEYADDALYSKAWLLERMDKGAESRRIYQEVIDKYPDSPFAPECYIQLAEYYFAPREDKTDDAQVIVELNKAIQLYKKVLKYKDSKRYDEALYKLGWSYYKLAARDPKYYTDAIMYFMAVADDIEKAKKLDPQKKITNANVRDEAIQYVGISFTDETYTKTGVDKARRMIERLGGKPYGPEIMRAIAETYQKIDEQEKAIYAFRTLLDMYPDYPEGPTMQQKIVDALYALGKDDEAFQARVELYEKYGPKSEWYANLEKSDEPDKLKYLKTAYKLSEAAMRTNLSLLLEKAQEAETSGQPATDEYTLFADNCKLYLDYFPADSNAYDINWSYAFVLDSKLGRLDDAYEEYIRVSNDYLETGHQHEAALNAVSVADTLVKMKYGKVDTVAFNIADIAKLSPEALTPEETRLIEAYDNYLRLFPNGEYAPDFLAAAGSIYYNHKKIPEAKVYFQTLVKRFPGAKQKSLALRSIMDSYFALGKFKDSEIIAKRIMADQDIPPEQREFAAKRLAAAIFKNAEYLAEQGDFFGAANEFYRVYEETPEDPKFVEAALYNSGRNYQKAKDWVRAISVFDTLATKYPQSKYAVPALENMADGYKELEQYVKAGETYERIFQNYPKSENAETALYNAGYYYKKGEAWQRAIDANNKYIATYPDKSFATDLFFANAELYLKLNNETEANRIYEEFARKYPDDPRTVTAYYERGKYYMESGLDSKAKEEFNKAIQRSEQFRKSGKDPNAYIAAEALNALGNILHKEYLAIKLTQPPSNIESQKERLRTTLTELNKTYSKVISFGSPRSFEATYNIARSYEEFANIYAHQEIDPNLPEAKRFVEKKRINEESAKLYEKAVDEYKKVIENIPKIADKLGVDMWAEKTEAEPDTLMMDSTQIARAAEIDSTQLLAQKYYHKAQDKISELLYTEAELTSNNVYQAINIKAPGTNPLQNLIYRFTVLQKVAKPAIEQTIKAHITSIQEAEKMGLSNKYVEESKRQILLTSNIMGEEVENLAHESLNQYRRIRDELKVMIEREFEAVNDQGLDYYALDNLASQMIDYVKDLGTNALNSYANTLQLAEEYNIRNDLIRNTEDRMLRFAIEITDEMESLADSAKKSSEYYRVRFDSTENYNYDDASGFFENYYYNLTDYSKEILDVAFQTKENFGIKNLWANKLIYKLIKMDPLAYSGSIEKDTLVVVSDDSWKAGTTYYEGEWPKTDFDDSSWEYARILTGYQNQFSSLGVNPDAIWYMEKLNGPTTPVDTLSDTTSFGLSDTTMTDSLQRMADTTGAQYLNESAAEYAYSDADTIVFFRKTIEVEGTPVSGAIYLTADDDYRVYLNGEYLLDDELNDYSVLDTLDFYTFQDFIQSGKNVFAVDVEDKDHSRQGLKFYAFLEILPLDITKAAEEKAKVKKLSVEPKILRKVNILNKNRITPRIAQSGE